MSKQKPEPFDEMEAAEQAGHQPAAAATEPAAAPTLKSTIEPVTAEIFTNVDAQKAAEYLAGWKRAQADYQNLRRSVEQERTDMMKYANQGLLQDLVPVLGHFNMAFKSVTPDAKSAAWLKGFEHIATNFKQVLQQYGVTLISTVGEQFNPEQHESVGEVASAEPEGMVVEEVSTGFLLHGKVMQPAKVKISAGQIK